MCLPGGLYQVTFGRLVQQAAIAVFKASVRERQATSLSEGLRVFCSRQKFWSPLPVLLGSGYMTLVILCMGQHLLYQVLSQLWSWGIRYLRLGF